MTKEEEWTEENVLISLNIAIFHNIVTSLNHNVYTNYCVVMVEGASERTTLILDLSLVWFYFA